MAERRKYLEILKIELDDLAEDIRALQEAYRRRAGAGEITDYVMLENVALLERELHGVSAARACLQRVSPDEYASLDEMTAAIGRAVADCLRSGGYEPALAALIERKLSKVAAYVRKGAAP